MVRRCEQMASSVPELSTAAVGSADMEGHGVILTLEELHHHVFRILSNTGDSHRLGRAKRLLERYRGEEEFVSFLMTILGVFALFVSLDWRLWKQRFSQDKERARAYGRSAVWKHPGCFQLLILTWAPGCSSPVHNHPCERCFLMPVTGSLAEARFWVDEETEEYGGPRGMVFSSWAEVCRAEMRTHRAYWIDDSHGWHAVMNTGNEDAVSLHLYVPEIVKCKIVHPKTHTISWTMCRAKGRDAPPAAYQRLVRIAARALKESSRTRAENHFKSTGSLHRAYDSSSSFSYFANFLLKALRSDQAFEQLRSNMDVFGTTRRALDSFGGLKNLLLFPRTNSEPLPDDVLLQAFEAVLQLCAGEEAMEAGQTSLFSVDERDQELFTSYSSHHLPWMKSLASSQCSSRASFDQSEEGEDANVASVWDGWREAPRLARVASLFRHLLLPDECSCWMSTTSPRAAALGLPDEHASWICSRRKQNVWSQTARVFDLLDRIILEHLASFLQANRDAHSVQKACCACMVRKKAEIAGQGEAPSEVETEPAETSKTGLESNSSCSSCSSCIHTMTFYGVRPTAVVGEHNSHNHFVASAPSPLTFSCGANSVVSQAESADSSSPSSVERELANLCKGILPSRYYGQWPPKGGGGRETFSPGGSSPDYPVTPPPPLSSEAVDASSSYPLKPSKNSEQYTMAVAGSERTKGKSPYYSESTASGESVSPVFRFHGSAASTRRTSSSSYQGSQVSTPVAQGGSGAPATAYDGEDDGQDALQEGALQQAEKDELDFRQGRKVGMNQRRSCSDATPEKSTGKLAGRIQQEREVPRCEVVEEKGLALRDEKLAEITGFQGAEADSNLDEVNVARRREGKNRKKTISGDRRDKFVGRWVDNEVTAIFNICSFARQRGVRTDSDTRRSLKEPGEQSEGSSVLPTPATVLSRERLVSKTVDPGRRSEKLLNSGLSVGVRKAGNSLPRRLVVFLCKESAYMWAFQEVARRFAACSSSDVDLVEVSQTGEGGVMSVADLRHKIAYVVKDSSSVLDLTELERTGHGEKQSFFGHEKTADGCRQKECNQTTASLVCCSAGRSGSSTGGFDDFTAIREVCDEVGAWMHVDGLFGASFLLPAEKPFQELCAGLGLADSLTWGFHAFLGATPTAIAPVALFFRPDSIDPGTQQSSFGSFSLSSLKQRASEFRSPAEGEVVEDSSPAPSPVGLGFPLWCLWRKLGDVGSANRVRQVYLRCRQMQLVAQHFPKRLKPPEFPSSPGSRKRTVAQAQTGLRTPEGVGRTADQINERNGKERHSALGRTRSEREGKRWCNTSKQAFGSVQEAGEHELGEKETVRGRAMRSESRGVAAQLQDDSYDDSHPGDYDVGSLFEESASYVRDNGKRIAHLVKEAQQLILKSVSHEEEGLKAHTETCRTNVYSARPQFLTPGNVLPNTEKSNRARKENEFGERVRDADGKKLENTDPVACLKALFHGDLWTGDTAEEARTWYDKNHECAYISGAFRAAMTERSASFAFHFWWIPPHLRRRVSQGGFDAVAAEQVKFFTIGIGALLTFLIERETGREESEETSPGAVEEIQGTEATVVPFRLNSDAVYIHLTSRKSVDFSQAESSLYPPFFSVSLLDPRIRDDDLFALLCLINRLGVLLVQRRLRL
ncbi:cysteine dioxygenase type i protein [Cystoisospora suis]|uniref:cysteine dioxygenase n=1 Tax=Cystoisospora suis TaxID=483139 RepID=A0A2C6KN48_9APIC|nr:cysteine dioxygenase type i protein [Cystoisospora suis]